MTDRNSFRLLALDRCGAESPYSSQRVGFRAERSSAEMSTVPGATAERPFIPDDTRHEQLCLYIRTGIRHGEVKWSVVNGCRGRFL